MRHLFGAAMAAITAVTSVTVMTGPVQARGWELDAPDERLEEVLYGLNQVCLPAQRAGMQVGDYEKANRSKLTLQRRRNPNSTRIPMWSMTARSDVAVLGDEAGCTVSTSFREDQSDRLLPDLRGALTEGASAYQVVSGNPDNHDERLVVAFCKPDGQGGVDSFYLYEWVQNEPGEVGRRQPREILYLSLIAPTERFCPQGAQ